MEIPEIILHAFLQKFRENNDFSKEVTKELISRNIFSVREMESFVFPHWAKCAHTLTFSWNQFITGKMNSRNILLNDNYVRNFHTFMSCTYSEKNSWIYWWSYKINMISRKIVKIVLYAESLFYHEHWTACIVTLVK